MRRFTSRLKLYDTEQIQHFLLVSYIIITKNNNYSTLINRYKNTVLVNYNYGFRLENVLDRSDLWIIRSLVILNLFKFITLNIYWFS